MRDGREVADNLSSRRLASLVGPGNMTRGHKHLAPACLRFEEKEEEATRGHRGLGSEKLSLENCCTWLARASFAGPRKTSAPCVNTTRESSPPRYRLGWTAFNTAERVQTWKLEQYAVFSVISCTKNAQYPTSITRCQADSQKSTAPKSSDPRPSARAQELVAF